MRNHPPSAAAASSSSVLPSHGPSRASPTPESAPLPHQHIVDAHFAAHDEELELEISQHVASSSASPPVAASVAAARSRLRAFSPGAPAASDDPPIRNRALKDISNTYQKMLEENRKQGEDLLELHRALGSETLRLQRVGLAEIKKATDAVQWFMHQQAQQIAAPANSL